MPKLANKTGKVSPAEKNWVETTIRELRALHQEEFKIIHQLRRMRFMRLKQRAPRAFQKIVSRGLASPMSYRLVQTTTGLIARERPRFERLPITDAPKHKAAASRLQLSADPTLQNFESIARRPLYWQLVDGLVGDGRGATKVTKEVWTGFPVRESNEDEGAYNQRVADFIMRGTDHPLRMKLVDPLNLLIPQEEYEMSHVVEQGKRPLLSTLKRLNLKLGVNKTLVPLETGQPYPMEELPRGMGASVDVEEVWTDETVYVRIGGNIVKFENDLGFIPYTAMLGETSSSADPALQGLSVIYPYQGIEPWLNTLLGTLAAWSIVGGLPILYTSRQPFQGAPPPGDTAGSLSDIPLGQRIDLGTGGQIGFVTPPPVGREVLEFINLLVQFLDRAGITPLASGIMGTRTPGTAYSAAIEAAIGKLAPLIANAERGLADTVKMSWRIVDQVLKQPIYVTGTGFVPRPLGIGRKKRRGRYVIDPADIDGYYDLACTLKTHSLQDTISRGMHAAFMRAHKLWSRDRAMRFSDVDDPWDEFLNITSDNLTESSMVQGEILRAALEEDPELAKRAAELEAQGVDVMAMLTGAEPAEGGGGGLFGGAPQPRGQPAPGAGGRPTASAKRPGGQRGGTPQGAQFPQ